MNRSTATRTIKISTYTILIVLAQFFYTEVKDPRFSNVNDQVICYHGRALYAYMDSDRRILIVMIHELLRRSRHFPMIDGPD